MAYTFPTDVIISHSEVIIGSKVLKNFVDSSVSDSVSVFSPGRIYKGHVYLYCLGYVPLRALCNQFVGSSRRLVYLRHRYVFSVFSSACARLLPVGQNPFGCYSRVRYDQFNKRYCVASFFDLVVVR